MNRDRLHIFDEDWSIWTEEDQLMIECLSVLGVAKVLWCEWDGMRDLVYKVQRSLDRGRARLW